MTLAGYSEPVLAAAFSPDGAQMVTASRDRLLKVRLTPPVLRECARRLCVFVCVVSGMRLLVRCGVAYCALTLLQVWDAKSGNELATLQGHTNWVVDCKYAPDGRTIVSASWDGTLRLWDSETGACVHTLSGHEKRVNACSFSHDGQRVLSASWDCSLVIWDPAKGAEVRN